MDSDSLNQRQDTMQLKERRESRARGVTLIELMTVMVIVAILASVAIPSYREYLRRAHRAAAKTALLEDAQFLERTRTVSNRYDLNASGGAITVESLPVAQAPKEDAAQYTITLTNLTATTFTLSAVPVPGGAVDGDACGTFTLDERAAKNITGSASFSSCWNK
jgi:type IV pilus assembly protein PilE